MTPMLAKAAFLLLGAAWYIIRFPYARRSRRTPVAHNAYDAYEVTLLLISLSGLGLIPLVYITTGFWHVADYTFRPAQAWLGILVGVAALAMFRLTHKALGRNWSISLQTREGHALVTDGIYRHVRHPMYTAFWLWALAQALLLPNWIAGFAGLIGFGTLFFGRFPREEQMMLDAFGDDYRTYVSSTSRVVPRVF